MALDQLLKLLLKLAKMLLLDGPGMDMNLRLELYMLLVHLDFYLNKVSDLF
uniref:Uncharacterized protein n=2 Tax=Picea TaxID=3328 RepID=A0A101LVI0_PICGL|nr:hypothetical protein ABT39_MTgene1911 [Picea glauca]QHR89896.1 hypothetical protein Q903MT_gene3918 [Picea sitchensis]